MIDESIIVPGLTVGIEAYGEKAMAERDLCVAVGEDLTRHYPGYDWLIGADVTAGMVVIDLPADIKPAMIPFRGKMVKGALFATQLRVSTVLGPGGQRFVMRAAGELLERFGLSRDRAKQDWKTRAITHGMDVG